MHSRKANFLNLIHTKSYNAQNIKHWRTSFSITRTMFFYKYINLHALPISIYHDSCAVSERRNIFVYAPKIPCLGVENAFWVKVRRPDEFLRPVCWAFSIWDGECFFKAGSALLFIQDQSWTGSCGWLIAFKVRTIRAAAETDPLFVREGYISGSHDYILWSHLSNKDFRVYSYQLLTV